MSQPPRPPGPNDSEQQMLELVYTRFNDLLERDPQKAARLATELADVSARFVAPQPAPNAGQQHIRNTRYAVPTKEK